VKKFAILWLLVCVNAYADVSFGTGESEDCNIAKALAVNDAIERYAEKEFEVKKQHICRERNAEGIECEYVKKTEIESAGTLKKVLTEKVKQKKDICVVEVKVELDQSRPLAGDIENASNFAYNGQKYPFDVITREPMYVYLFSVYDDKMHMMYPYDGIKSNLLHGKLTLPNGIWWQADIMSNAPESKDTLMAVFTKVKITFGSSMTRDEIYRQISSVPINARRVVYHNFVIKRRT
jgi:hypothetical protein